MLRIKLYVLFIDRCLGRMISDENSDLWIGYYNRAWTKLELAMIENFGDALKVHTVKMGYTNQDQVGIHEQAFRKVYDFVQATFPHIKMSTAGSNWSKLLYKYKHLLVS